MTVGYDEIARHCETLSYRDKFRLAQLLIQLARREEEEQSPERRAGKSADQGTVEYVAERLLKSKPGRKPALLRNRNLLTCALLRSSRNGAIIPCWQKRIKEDAHVLLEICRHFSSRFIDLIDDMNERLESR
jgi:hypothetical protein